MSLPADKPLSDSSSDSGQTDNQLVQVTGFDLNSELISIPRWIVYFQGALLGVVAATFFVFGLMVGNLTSGAGSQAEQRINCRVSGRVVYTRDGTSVADTNAVVFLLPVDRKPDERVDSTPVHPDTFEPLDNPSIDCIASLGGAVVRVNEQGAFHITVDGPQEYHVLVVSANQYRDPAQKITKFQKAAVGTFFRPAEGLIGEQAFHWSTVDGDREAIDLPTVQFE